MLYANTAKALIVGAVLAFLLRKKFCFHLHDILSSDHFSAINRRLIVLLANRAEAVVRILARRRRLIELTGKAGAHYELSQMGFPFRCFEPTHFGRSGRVVFLRTIFH